MGKRIKEVDDYIAAAPEFAAPILVRIRELVHAACPEIEESIKWGAPHFLYKGLFAGMAAFKEHCKFGLWHGGMNPQGTARAKGPWGDYGRMTSVKDLPSSAVFKQMIRDAKKMVDDGVKRPRIRKPKALI